MKVQHLFLLSGVIAAAAMFSGCSHREPAATSRIMIPADLGTNRMVAVTNNGFVYFLGKTITNDLTTPK